MSNTDTTQERRKPVQVTLLPSVHRAIKERARLVGKAPGRVIEEAFLASQLQPMHTAPRDGSVVSVQFGATLYRNCWFDAQLGRWRWGANADVLAAEPNGWVAW